MFRYMRYIRSRPIFLIDVSFAVILALLYVSMRSGLGALTSEIDTLGLASFALLGLGALVFYLIEGTSRRLATLIHSGFFPFLSISYLFLKWLPGVINKGLGGVSLGTLGAGLLVYVLVLIGFFTVQFTLFVVERERARRRP